MARGAGWRWAVATLLVVVAGTSGGEALAATRPPAARGAQSAPAEQVITSSDGYTVHIRVSPAYPPEAGVAETAMHTLDGLLHGPELASLRLFLTTPTEAEALCGGAPAIACYSTDQIVLPAEQPVGSPPVAFLLAHEYAHHILAHRRNDPWPADLWGPKRWATELDVCAEVRRHELFLDYASVPGEAFAETYATMHFPWLHLPWTYTDLLAPDDDVWAALRADVLDPWAGPTSRRYAGKLDRGGSRTIRLKTPRDGTARVSVTGRPSVALEVRAGRKVLARARPRRASG